MATFQEFLRVAEITAKDKTSHKRMKEMLRIARKYHLLAGLTPEKVVQVLQALGPTYVKIGQLMSNRSDMLPKEYCDALSKLRDEAEPMAFSTVIEQIDASYGKPWQTVFSSIQEKPLGSASIAQVHKATLHDGTVVAVKVRRPGVAETMAEDIMLMKHLVYLGDFLDNVHRDILLTLQGFIEEIEKTTADEVDFTVELHNLVRFRKEIADEKGVTCPIAYPKHSTDAVLVMEFVQGVEITDVKAVEAQGASIDKLAERMTQSYVDQVLDAGFFHADPHPGNVLVRDGEIVWIDLGMVGTLTASERLLVGRMFTAVTTGDSYMLKEAVLGLTKPIGPVNHGQVLNTLARLLSQYSSAELGDINVGVVFNEIIEMLRAENLIMVSSVTMLARGIVTLEGVVASISPRTSVIGIVSQHVLSQNTQPSYVTDRLFDMTMSSLESAQAMAKLPTQISNTLDIIDRGQLEVQGQIDLSTRVLSTLYASVGRLSLALLSAGLFLGSSILCTTSMEPKLLGVPMLGVFGYIGAAILGVFTIWRILVTRHRMVNNEEPK